MAPIPSFSPVNCEPVLPLESKRADQSNLQRHAVSMMSSEYYNYVFINLLSVKDLSERCVKSSPTGAGHVVSCDVEVDYPLRLFGSPIPLIDLTFVSDSNRANVSEIVRDSTIVTFSEYRF